MIFALSERSIIVTIPTWAKAMTKADLAQALINANGECNKLHQRILHAIGLAEEALYSRSKEHRQQCLEHILASLSGRE